MPNLLNQGFSRVPQIGNGGPQGKLINDGGLDVYYIPSGKTTAFKKVDAPLQPLRSQLTKSGLPYASWLGHKH